MIYDVKVISVLMSVYVVFLFVYEFEISGVVCVRAVVHACLSVCLPNMVISPARGQPRLHSFPVPQNACNQKHTSAHLHITLVIIWFPGERWQPWGWRNQWPCCRRRLILTLPLRSLTLRIFNFSEPTLSFTVSRLPYSWREGGGASWSDMLHF